jgi:hypothetical protein
MASISSNFSRRVVAPVEELFDCTRVRQARVAVADGRGKEFDEAAAGALALDADNRRQRSRLAQTNAGGGYLIGDAVISDQSLHLSQ